MTIWLILLPAFSLGLLSSFHCVGMCGPLALSLPIQQLSRPRQRLAIGAYHAGRITIYMIAGAIVGLFGHGIFLAGFQQGFSIVLGLLVLLILIISRLRSKSRFTPKVFAVLQGFIYRLWQSPAQSKFLLMGMANGLLPCGMVYLALAGALTTTRAADAILFMLFFGLGTLPLLFILSYYGHHISIRLRGRIKKAMPVIITSMALLLILRGLGLGIPFISPVLPGHPAAAISCH